MSIRPLTDFVLIEPDADNTKRGDLILTGDLKDAPSAGTVVATGVTSIKVGMRVLHYKAAGTTVREDGKVLKMLSKRDIMGIYE